MPSVPGLLRAVGNVGKRLADYIDSNTFLSRDAGFTWQEVHKDGHLWEAGLISEYAHVALVIISLFTKPLYSLWTKYTVIGELIFLLLRFRFFILFV
jgi:hypothetical protein